MIQSRFEQNRKALEEKNPALLSLVSQSKLSLPPFPTPSGHPTCRIRGENGELVLLHSDQDPVAEAEEAIHTKGEDAILLLGMGLGYTGLELVRRLSPWTWITVIEPDPGILRAAMEYVDLTPGAQDLIYDADCVVLLGHVQEKGLSIAPFVSYLGDHSFQALHITSSDDDPRALPGES